MQMKETLTEAGQSGHEKEVTPEKRRENSESGETERQHMHWQRYKLQLERRGRMFYAQQYVCSLKPNNGTECGDSSLLAAALAIVAV